MSKEPNDTLFEILIKYDIPVTSKGFYYITWMVEKASKQDSYILNYTDYEKCAEEFNSTAARVERSIRYALSHSNLNNSKNLATIYFLTREYIKQKN